MKHYFIFTVIALAISFATGCKKDDSTPETTKKEAIPHKANIAYYKTDVKDISTYKELIDQTVAEYNTLLATVGKLPQYPKDKYKYAGQVTLGQKERESQMNSSKIITIKRAISM